MNPAPLISALIRARYLTFALVVGLLVGLVALDRHVEYEQSLTAFFPAGDPDVQQYMRASAVFGNDNVVFVTYDDPALLTPEGMDRVAELASAVAEVDAVTDLQALDRMPLFWQIDEGLAALVKLPAFARRLAVKALSSNVESLGRPDSAFTVGGAIRRARGEALDALRQRVTTHPLLVGTLVTPEGTSTALVVRLRPMEEQDPKATVAALRAAADGFARRHGLARPALVGPPVLLADGFTAIEADGRRLSVVGMALIGLVTLSVTRSLWWAIVPMLAGWSVWLAAEAVMATLGLKLSLSGGPLVAQIIVLTMPAASHLAIHFHDRLRDGTPRREGARFTIAAVAVPIFWTAVTGAVGYGALLSSRVVPVFQFGAVLAVCTLVASLLTLGLSPIAMFPPFPLQMPVRPGTSSRLGSASSRLILWVLRHPLGIVLTVFAIVIPLGAGLLRLDYESNYINAFKPDSRVVNDYNFTESRLGGIGVVSLVVPAGETLDLANLARSRKLAEAVEGLRRQGEPAVTQVVSLATVLDPEGTLAALPPAQGEEALRIKLGLIESSPQGELLHGFWSPRDESSDLTGWSRLVVRVHEAQPALEKEKTFHESVALAREMVPTDDPARAPYLTGLSFLLTQTTRGVIESSWMTIVWSSAGILLMLSLAFRGPRLAFLALLPTVLAVVLVLGATAWLGVKLDIATALVASVALGLSVDDTFHCLLQFRRNRLQHETFREALLASYQVTGPGVLLSSLAVALGFAVLRFSEFVPFSNFGTMVGVATLGSSIGNVVLLPACLALGHRWSERRHPDPPGESPEPTARPLTVDR